jgi:hypothetical protein
VTHDEALALLQAQVPVITRNAWLSSRPGQCTELEGVARNVSKALSVLRVDTPATQE